MSRKPEHLRNRLDLRGWERIDAALARGRGVVLLTAHLGTPKLLRWYLRCQAYPVIHVYRFGIPARAKSVEQRFKLLLRKRHNLDQEALVGGHGVDYIKGALDHLRKNGIVNISGDGPRGSRRVAITVAGAEKTLPIGGFMLGSLAGAEILPVFSQISSHAALQIEVQEPLRAGEYTSREEHINQLAAAYAERLDAFLKDHPTVAGSSTWFRDKRRRPAA
ncbi:MAG: hypothetical protein P8J87_19575 [Verrucomicrobiales bacterium]|nr:hypothetical protein [Verrucomicrobiales bacterium]